MSAATIDAPTAAPPITDDEVEAFARWLEEEVPACAVCPLLHDGEVRPAEGNTVLVPCAHSWLTCRLCYEHLVKDIERYSGRRGIIEGTAVRCAQCGARVRSATWVTL